MLLYLRWYNVLELILFDVNFCLISLVIIVFLSMFSLFWDRLRFVLFNGILIEVFFIVCGIVRLIL